MGALKLRELGTIGPQAPNIKRATMCMADGKTVYVLVDTNLSAANGDDVTGVAKIYFWVAPANNTGTFIQQLAYTTAVACASSTRNFVGSFTIDSSNNIHFAYAGTDNSLRHVYIAGWNGTTWATAAVEQVIQTSNAVANRWRAIDIDVAGTASPAVFAYEALSSAGAGAYARLFVRKTDNTTWIKAHERYLVNTALFVRAGGEDVSLSYSGPIVSNVGKFALYATQVATTVDSGDVLWEVSWNVSTGTTNSGTLMSTWLSSLNKNVASGSRKGWIFNHATGRWTVALAVGSSAPTFEGIRIQDNVFTGVVRNKIGAPPAGRVTDGYWHQGRYVMYPDANKWSYVSATYFDNRLIFGFSGIGEISSRSVRMLMMRWASSTETGTTSYKDITSRPMNSSYSPTGGGVIGVYGGANKNLNAGLFDYPFVAWYGDLTTTVSNVEDVREREAWAVWEDNWQAPEVLRPAGISPVNRPLLQVSHKNSSLYNNAFAKPEWQVARDSGFTVDLRTIVDGSTGFEPGTVSPRTISYQMNSTDLPLYSGTWYVRAAMSDDLAGTSAYSATRSFVVSHPPVAAPSSPGGGVTLPYTTGSATFSWVFQDSEPTDTQSAYRLLVERQDTGATVHDTNKVVSSDRSVTIALDPSIVDVPLQWRISLWDADDVQGAYSNPLSFTMANAPTVALTNPTQGQVLTTALPTFQWTFTAGGTRTQKAFRITVYDVSSSPVAAVAETGWIFTDQTSYTFPAKILNNNKTYSVVIQVQDTVGMISAANREVGLTQVVTNSNFEVNAAGWTGTSGTATRSTAQAHRGSASLLITANGGAAPHADSNSFNVVPGQTVRAWGWMYLPVATHAVGIMVNFYNDIGTFISTLGGTVSITGATWSFRDVSVVAPAGAATATINVGTSATPAASYLMYFDEVQANGGGAEFVTFDTDWVEPVHVVPTVATDPFKMTISWTDAAKDMDFVAWRVYRRYMRPAIEDFDVNGTRFIWELLYETNDDAASLSFRDYTAPLNKAVDYVVVQLVDRFGSLLESEILGFATATQQGSRYYFIPEIPIGAIASFEAGSIRGDNFSQEIEQEAVHVIGRGRQVQIGDDLGYSGTLEVQLLNPANARRDREFFELLASPDTGNVYMKTPFGDVHFVRLLNVATKREGGHGTEDIASLSIPYLVVFDEVPPITRTV